MKLLQQEIFRRNAWKMYLALSLVSLVTGLGAWVVAGFVQMGWLGHAGFMGYPASVHQELLLGPFLLFFILSFSHREKILHPDFLDKSSGNLTFLTGGLVTLLFFALPYPPLHRLALAILYLLLALELLPYRTDSHPLAGYLMWSLLFFATGFLFSTISFADRYSFLFSASRTLVQQGGMMLLYIALLETVLHRTLKERSQRIPGIIPGHGIPYVSLPSAMLLLFLLTFPIEWLHYYFNRSAPSLLLTPAIRAGVTLFWVSLILPHHSFRRLMRQPSQPSGWLILISLLFSVVGWIGFMQSYSERSQYTHLFFVGGVGVMALLSMGADTLDTTRSVRFGILSGRSAIATLILLVAIGRAIFPVNEAGYYAPVMGALALITIIGLVSLFFLSLKKKSH